MGWAIFSIFLIAIIAGVSFVPLSRRAGKKKAHNVGALRMFEAIHIAGLGVGETLCEVYLFTDKVRVDNSFTNQKFEIPINRLYKAEDEPVRKRKSFSLGKALLGEAIAGPLGAIIAGSSGSAKAQGLKRLAKLGFMTSDLEEREVVFATKKDSQGIAVQAFNSTLRTQIAKIKRTTVGTKVNLL